MTPKLRTKAQVGSNLHLHRNFQQHHRNAAGSEAADSKWFSWLGALWPKEYTAFEKELYKALMDRFDKEFQKQYIDWVAAKRIQFAHVILAQAQRIEEETSEWQGSLANVVTTIQTQQLFASTEAKISSYGKHFATAMQVSAGFAACAAIGGTTTTTAFVVGAVSTSLAIGGVVAVATIGVASLVTAGLALAKVSSQSDRTEERVRLDVVTNLLSVLTSISKNS